MKNSLQECALKQLVIEKSIKDGTINNDSILSILSAINPKNSNNKFSNTYVPGEPENGKEVVHPGFSLKIPITKKTAGLINTAMKSHQQEKILHFDTDLKFSKDSNDNYFLNFSSTNDFFSDIFKRPSIAKTSFDTESFARYYAMFATLRHLSLSGMYKFPKENMSQVAYSLPFNREVNEFMQVNLKDKNKGIDGISDRELLNSDFNTFLSLNEKIELAIERGRKNKVEVENKEEPSGPSFGRRRT